MLPPLKGRPTKLLWSFWPGTSALLVLESRLSPARRRGIRSLSWRESSQASLTKHLRDVDLVVAGNRDADTLPVVVLLENILTVPGTLHPARDSLFGYLFQGIPRVCFLSASRA